MEEEGSGMTPWKENRDRRSAIPSWTDGGSCCFAERIAYPHTYIHLSQPGITRRSPSSWVVPQNSPSCPMPDRVANSPFLFDILSPSSSIGYWRFFPSSFLICPPFPSEIQFSGSSSSLPLPQGHLSWFRKCERPLLNIKKKWWGWGGVVKKRNGKE